MDNEDKNNIKQERKETIEPIDKPLSIVDEAKAIRDEIVKARDSLKEENDRSEKLQAENMLSGTSGGHVKAEEPKEISDIEYSEKVMSGEIGDDKQ